MSFSCTFELMSSNRNFPEAEIKISKRESSVAFKCRRNVRWINKKVEDFFFNAIRGYAFSNLTGESSRGFLIENRKGRLDRKENYDRHNYETFVIGEILKSINLKNEFHVKLAICGSGKLLGEEILLFRLIHKLKQHKGTLELILIDPIYQDLSKNAKPGDFDDGIGEQKYVGQFLEEMSECLPEKILLEGRFFSNGKEYVSFVQSNPLANYDFLIGINDNSNPDFLLLEDCLDMDRKRSIIWTPTAEFPEASLPNTTYSYLRDLYPSDGGVSVSVIPKEDKTVPIKTIAAISMAILLGIAYLKGSQK